MEIYLPCIAKVAHLPQTKKLSKQAFTSIEEISTTVFHSPYDSLLSFLLFKNPTTLRTATYSPLLEDSNGTWMVEDVLSGFWL